MQRFSTYKLIVLFAVFLSHSLQGQTDEDTLRYRNYMDSSKITQYENPDLAIYYATKAADFGRENGFELPTGHAEFQLSRLYKSVGKLNAAKKHATEALRIYEKNKFDKGTMKVKLNIGHLHVQQDDYIKGEKYYLEALDLGIKLKDTLSIAYIYQGLGNRFYFDDSLSAAEVYMSKSEELLNLLGKEQLMGGLLVNLGNIKQDRQQLNEAKAYYLKALKLYTSQNNLLMQALVRYNLGDIHRKQEDFDSALLEFNQVLELGKQTQSWEDIKYAYLGLSNTYQDSKEYESAFLYLEKYHDLKDSLSAADYQKEVDKWEAQYLSEKREKELEEIAKNQQFKHLEDQKKLRKQEVDLIRSRRNQTLLWVVGGILILLLIGSYSANQRFKRKNSLILEQKRVLNEQNQLIDKSLKEKELLLKEIHHRVKNNLQMISSLLNLQSQSLKSEEALKAFENSKNRVRAIASVHAILYTKKDLAKINIREYLNDLIRNQFSKDNLGREVKYQIDVDDKELNLDTAIPLGLIINELITNSLKHAFKEESKQPEITIQFSDEEVYLLDYRDNGEGLPKDFSNRESGSLGFEIITALCDQLDGDLEISDQTEGAHFILKFKEQ